MVNQRSALTIVVMEKSGIFKGFIKLLYVYCI